MKTPDESELDDDVELITEYRDADRVMRALDLSGHPLWVDMRGRTVIFAHPRKEKEE